MQPRWVETLSAAERDTVVEIVSAARIADRAEPLSDQTLIELSRASRHLLVDAGYARLDGAAAELVVHPEHRREGVGTALLAELRTAAAGRLETWAHGDLPAAQAFARARGLRRGRVLWQLRRDASDPLPTPHWPDGVTVRTFEPGRDEPAWLQVNAAAFAHHPEQGRWTLADLRDREAQDWFDPTGFFLADRAGELVGFHWTKRHDADTGEVYVVGVAPAAEGSGLGRALTIRGLAHLRDAGCAAVILYVDEDNPRALGMYERLGFTRAAADVVYAAG